MSDGKTVDPFSDPARANERMLATLYLVLIYGVVVPFLGALLGYARHLLSGEGPTFINLKGNFEFWLLMGTMFGTPVLLLGALIHFIVRRRPLWSGLAWVVGVGALPWLILSVVDRGSDSSWIYPLGALVMAGTFLVARGLYHHIVGIDADTAVRPK